jgi:predicted RNA-binding protein with PIN domain
VTVAVAFDGAPDDHFPDGSLFMGVRVYYAARGSDADERIRKLVDDERERRTLVVVTSDRQLAGYVRRSGVKVLSAGEFRRRLDAVGPAAADTTAPGASDPPPPTRDELLREMRYFGVAPEDDE